MADLDSLNKEDLTAFKFIARCNDKRLREKLFEAKRKGLTAIKEIVDQHTSLMKDEKTLTSQPTKTIAAVTQSQPRSQRGQRGGQGRTKLPPELKGCCTSCGNSSHKAVNCVFKKNKVVCDNWGKEGHLAKVCFSNLCQKANRDTKDEPPPYAAANKGQGQRHICVVGADDWRDNREEDHYNSESDEVWKRLPLTISRKREGKTRSSFQFCTFPDTGSAATLIAEDVAKREGMEALETVPCTYLNVSGEIVPTLQASKRVIIFLYDNKRYE